MLKTYLITSEGITEQLPISDALSRIKEKHGPSWVDLRAYNSDEVKQITDAFRRHASVEVESLHEDYTRPHST